MRQTKLGSCSEEYGKKHMCVMCNAAFKKVHDLKRHQRTHTGERPFKCETCGMSFSQSSSLKIHLRKHTGERPLRCAWCDLTFMYSSTLLAHQKIHSVSLQSFVCNFCQCQFVRSSDLKKHERLHITGETETLKKPQESQSLESETPSFTNTSTCALSKNDDKDKGGEVIPEPSYSHLQNIKTLKLKSQQKTNSSTSLYLCDVCGTHCTDAATLKDHLKIHSGIKPYICSVCSRSFLRRSNLKKHEHMHTGEKPHKCKDCGKSFAQFGNLKIHMRIHTGEKPFVCPVCSVRFTHSQALKMHSKIHSGARPYVCAQCGSSFRWSASYKNHIKLHECNKLGSSCEESNSSVRSKKDLPFHKTDIENKGAVEDCITEDIKSKINCENQSDKKLTVLRRNYFPLVVQSVDSCSSQVSSTKEKICLQPSACLHTFSQNHPQINIPTQPPGKMTSDLCIVEDSNKNDTTTTINSSCEWLDAKLDAILDGSGLWKNPAAFNALDKLPVTPEESVQTDGAVPSSSSSFSSSFSSPNNVLDSSGKFAVHGDHVWNQSGNLVLGSPQIVEMLSSTTTLNEMRWENSTLQRGKLPVRNREEGESESTHHNTMERPCNNTERNQHKKSEDECNSHYEELLPITTVLEVMEKDRLIKSGENFTERREPTRDMENCLGSLFLKEQIGEGNTVIPPFSELFESRQHCRVDMNEAADEAFSLPRLKCSESKDLRPHELINCSELDWSEEVLLSCKSQSGSVLKKGIVEHVQNSNDSDSNKVLESQQVMQAGKNLLNIDAKLPVDDHIKNLNSEQSNITFREKNVSSDPLHITFQEKNLSSEPFSDNFGWNIPSKYQATSGGLVEEKKNDVMDKSSNTATQESCTFPSMCNKCGKNFNSASDLQAHLALCTSYSKEVLCEECGARFTRSYDLKRHQRIHGDQRSFVCDDCGLSFTQASTLKVHMRTHSGEKPFHCKECPSSFSHSSTLKTHIKLRHSGSQENICARIEKDKTYICRTCSSLFTSYQSFKEHCKVHKPLVSTPYLCDFCGKAFLVVTALKRHLAKHEKSKEKFECQVCGKQCSKLSNLRKHEKTHSGERPFTCGECGSSFTQKGNLLVHLRIHTGEKPFFCKICGARFSHSQALKVHTKFHIGVREFPCQHCGKAFVTRAVLNKHVRSHTGDKPYKCSVCGAQLASSSSLSKHKKMHNVKNLPFACQVCAAGFAKAAHLKVHMGTHNKTHLRSRSVSKPSVSCVV